MVTALCPMLSPILTFTSDEAWEFIPGTGKDSVHLAEWKPLSFKATPDEEKAWASLFQLRESVLAELEKARQAKLIGKALEAKVVLSVPQNQREVCDQHREDLRELLNVSQLELQTSSAEAAVTAKVLKADGQKCERCWHWETDVGSHPAHPTICGRCVRAVEGGK
jgi:isoleucyl-tRNA synthetase